MIDGWYSTYTPDGKHLLSGNEVILDNGVPVLLRGEPLRGSKPCPLNNREFVWNPGNRQGARVYDLWTGTDREVYPRELSELAAGGGVIAGRDAEIGALVIIRPGLPLESIGGAGQPSVAADGTVVYRSGDDRIEPSICLTARAWGDGDGRLFALYRGMSSVVDVTAGPWEARAFLFDGPDNWPWTLCMGPNGALHCRPLFSTEGYRLTPGNDRNIFAYAVCIGTEVKAVWQSTRGEQFTHTFDLTAARIPLAQAPPVVVPPVQPPPPEEPEPVSDRRLPDAVKATIRAMWPRVKHLHAGSDEDRRVGTRMIAEQVVYSHPGEGYGTKSADPNRPASKDALAQEVGLKMFGLDMIDGGTRELNIDGPMEDISDQHFIPVEPVNHLGVTTPQEPPVTNPVGECKCDEKIAALSARLDETIRLATAGFDGANRRLTTLETRPAPTAPDLTGYVAKGTVSVGWLSKTVTLPVVKQ